jgi:hypothetical protein
MTKIQNLKIGILNLFGICNFEIGALFHALVI